MQAESYVSQTSTSPLLYATIGDALDATVAAHGDALALVVRHQGIRWTYAQYRDEVDRLARGLLALGVGVGDRVGIWAPNCMEWCLTQFATARIGAILVCINPAYRLYELEYALNKVRCSVLVSAERFKTSDYLGMLRTLAPEMEPASLASCAAPSCRTCVTSCAWALNMRPVCGISSSCAHSAAPHSARKWRRAPTRYRRTTPSISSSPAAPRGSRKARP